MDNSQLIDIFLNRGLIDQYLADDIIQEIENSGKEISEILSDYDVIQEKDDIWPIIANELSAGMVDLNNFEPPPELLAMIPAGLARLHGPSTIIPPVPYIVHVLFAQCHKVHPGIRVHVVQHWPEPPWCLSTTFVARLT